MRAADLCGPPRGSARVGPLRGLQGEAALKRWLHLSARFFDVVSARPLDPSETQEVRDLLESGEAALFFAQTAADQRHGLEGARAVGGSRRLIRTALLHDVGKRHARLGPLGRVVATLLAMLRIPLSGRMAQYDQHGAIGADELSDLGEPDRMLEYVRFHHTSMPAGYPADEWSSLQGADSARIVDRR